MFFGIERNQAIDESKIKNVITTEIYSAILDFINIITEKKGATTKYQERVAREFYIGLQEVVKNTVEETLKNMLKQSQTQTQQRKSRKSKKIELEPE